MHVALLGSEQDPQIQHIAKALHQNNTPFYFANTQHFGSTVIMLKTMPVQMLKHKVIDLMIVNLLC